VDASNTISLKTVTLGRDFGTHIEIMTGVQSSDKVIDNPGDAITSGEAVKIAKSASAS
jgi:hypothetical protein